MDISDQSEVNVEQPPPLNEFEAFKQRRDPNQPFHRPKLSDEEIEDLFSERKARAYEFMTSFASLRHYPQFKELQAELNRFNNDTKSGTFKPIRVCKLYNFVRQKLEFISFLAPQEQGLQLKLLLHWFKENVWHRPFNLDSTKHTTVNIFKEVAAVKSTFRTNPASELGKFKCKKVRDRKLLFYSDFGLSYPAASPPPPSNKVQSKQQPNPKQKLSLELRREKRSLLREIERKQDEQHVARQLSRKNGNEQHSNHNQLINQINHVEVPYSPPRTDQQLQVQYEQYVSRLDLGLPQHQRMGSPVSKECRFRRLPTSDRATTSSDDHRCKDRLRITLLKRESVDNLLRASNCLQSGRLDTPVIQIQPDSCPLPQMFEKKVQKRTRKGSRLFG